MTDDWALEPSLLRLPPSPLFLLSRRCTSAFSLPSIPPATTYTVLPGAWHGAGMLRFSTFHYYGQRKTPSCASRQPPHRACADLPYACRLFAARRCWARYQLPPLPHIVPLPFLRKNTSRVTGRPAAPAHGYNIRPRLRWRTASINPFSASAVSHATMRAPYYHHVSRAVLY